MKQMDLIVQKDREVARLNDTIRGLEERLANLNILLGGKDEALKHKDNEIKRIKDESNKSDRVVVKTVRPRGPYGQDVEEITYKNFDLVKQELKTEVEKKAKRTIADLENTQLDLEIQVETLQKEVARKVQEVEDKNRRKLNKLIEDHKEEVEDLKEEIVKIKKNKTEQQLEEAHERELKNLEITVEFLNKRLDLLRSKNWFLRLIDKITGAETKLNLELEEMKLKSEVLKKQAEAAYAANNRYSSRAAAQYNSPFYTYGTYGMPCSTY